MPDTCKIYVVRHGESEANRDDICGGDTPLTAKGREQASEARQLLENVHFDAAFSSDLERAVDTAAIIFGHDIPEENRLPALRERDFGPIEGAPNEAWMAIKEPWEAKYAALPFAERSRYDYAEGIENDGELSDRIMAALEQIATTHSGQIVLVAAHAGPVRVLLMHLGFADFLTVGSFKNAGYVELLWDGEHFSIGQVVGIQKPN